LSHPKGDGKAGRPEAAKSGDLTGSSPLDRDNARIAPKINDNSSSREEFEREIRS